MTKRAVLLFLVLQAIRVSGAIQGPECNGVIYGALFELSGQRVQGVNVVVWPIGVDLSYVLPHMKTDHEGEYRFENLCPGRFSVGVDDVKAGYPDSSPGLNAFLYGSRIPEVKLTANHNQAELPVCLPPKPGLMRVRITNGETKKEVLKFSLKLRVPGQSRTPEASFEFDPRVEEHEIEVPPDRDVILHVTAKGFHEWSESAGHGKLIRVPSGSQAVLEAELKPSR